MKKKKKRFGIKIKVSNRGKATFFFSFPLANKPPGNFGTYQKSVSQPAPLNHALRNFARVKVTKEWKRATSDRVLSLALVYLLFPPYLAAHLSVARSTSGG